MRTAGVQELDREALEQVFGDLEILERDGDANYDKIIGRILNDAHERIKHLLLIYI